MKTKNRKRKRERKRSRECRALACVSGFFTQCKKVIYYEDITAPSTEEWK